jgi:hypothetical protein
VRSQPKPMRGPTDDFTPIEFEFLKFVWIAKLQRDGYDVNDEFYNIVLARS